MAEPPALPVTESPEMAESNRDDLVVRLKAELAKASAATAEAEARASLYETKERDRMQTYQGEAQYFLKDWIVNEAKEYHEGTQLGNDILPLAAWADEYTSKKDISSQGALAAMSYVASKGVKRLREEASKASAASEALAATLKENEELKANLAKVSRDRDDAIDTATERQKGLAAMEAQLHQAGLVSKWDFSKSVSREEAIAAAAGVAPAEPHAASVASPALVEVQAMASKAAASAQDGPRANPLEASGDLLSNLLSRANGGLKVSNSGTSHAFLGSQSGEPDISTILRMGA